MSWSAGFLMALSRSQVQMRYRLRVLLEADAPGEALQLSQGWIDHQHLPILVGPPIVSGHSVGLVDWSSGSSSWTVQLSGPEASLRAVVTRITQGTLVGIEAGPAGWALADWQRIVSGQVVDIVRTPGGLTLGCVGLAEALRCRLTTDFDGLPLCPNAGASSPLTVAYTPGDGTLNVTPGTGDVVFEQETGDLGLVRIDSSVSSTSFYLLYSGRTADTITGCSTTGRYGTTAAAANIGDPVVNIPVVRGHPVEVVLKMLLSTGTGAHGIYDVLPETWGFGLTEDLVDVADATAWQSHAMVLSSGTYRWGLRATSPLDNPLSWLRGKLAAAGIWLVERQGKLSVRCAQALGSGAPYGPLGEFHQTALAEVRNHRLLSGQAMRTYRRCRVTGPTTSTFVGPGGSAALPTTQEIEYDLSDVAWTSETEVLTETRDRLVEWATYRAERLEGVSNRMHLAQWVPGDILTLDARHLKVWGRQDAVGTDYLQRDAMVTGVTADWGSWTTSLQLGLLPGPGDPFPV